MNTSWGKPHTSNLNSEFFRYIYVYVAVPDRNWILFHWVFRAHHRVWRAIALSFHLICLQSAYESRPLWKLSATTHQNWWCTRNTRCNNIRFLSGTATYICSAQSWDCVAHSQNPEIAQAISRSHNMCAIWRLRKSCVCNLKIACTCTPNSKWSHSMEDILDKRCLPPYYDLEEWVMLCIDEKRKRSRSHLRFGCWS